MMETSRSDRYRRVTIVAVDEAAAMGLSNDRHRQRMPVRTLGFVGLALIGALGACQSGSVFSDDGSSGSGGYPSLRSVPVEARPSSSIDERRQIVRTLLEERDQSRLQTAIVRRRSGLSVDLPSDSAGGDARAEDIVPDASGGDGVFRLTPGDDDDTDAAYRSDSQFDDGGLDDFIRQLKRDTRTVLPPDAPAETDEPVPEEPGEDDVSALFPKVRAFAGLPERGERPILLAAFVPTIARSPSEERGVMIRLAAAEEEPGFFCRYLGWSIAWSSMCVDETDAEQMQDGDEDVGADLEQELRQSPEEESSGRSAGTPSPSSNEAGRERVERRLSEQDAAEAIEEAGRSALAPVTSSLEKLRDFIQDRRSGGTTSSSPERRPSYRSETPMDEAAAIDHPPIPESRPKRREDLAIEDRGERFDFIRTPRPAFKPTPDEPVILKAKGEHRSEPRAIERFDPPPEPLFRPNDPLAELKGDGAGVRAKGDAGDGMANGSIALALTTEASSDLETEMPAKAPVARLEMSDPLSVSKRALEPEASIPGPAAEHAAMVIVFEPEMPGLPEGLEQRLRTMLEVARAQDQKIHIIGEASTNHLARRRATDVGAALVQLGATVEILEYDHNAKNGVDQVRLVLRPVAFDPLARSAEPTVIQK